MTTPGASRDCRETDLTTERWSLTTEVCPSWENASRSSERQSGITAVMSTAVCQAETGLGAGPGPAQGACCSSLAFLLFLRGPSASLPNSEFVSEQRLFRTGCGSIIVCSGLPVHNSTALPASHFGSSGCARPRNGTEGRLGDGVKRSWGALVSIARDTRARASASCRYLFDTVLAEHAIVKAEREVPGMETDGRRGRG
ncbi:hypothetical protein BDP81DRAFT_80699 [Colletotrichum phormii]|uniref:Uncharacterized protein n=1 Tax=Colletotrichum phormii TaxID=359342 RepID=A0AAJ0A0P0_9PEZI|nr:uncharacterized protein BDP81DRAFT_80699 [Colletotrichum phormii]KAK1654290.1 hypothetical protein BDP81DRAFT_80699 [Colletotrichum phormii]